MQLNMRRSEICCSQLKIHCGVSGLGGVWLTPAKRAPDHANAQVPPGGFLRKHDTVRHR